MKQKSDMLEPLMASLLTLDWEISSQSIRKFEKELEVLKEELGDDPHSKKLIDLSMPICNYLRVRKGSASPASIQFLHEATRTLYRFRQGRKLSVVESKETIKKLVNKFGNFMADVQRINLKVEQATRPKSAPAAAEPGTKPARKAPVKKKGQARKAAVQKTQKQSPTAEVLSVIKRHKKGIDVATLKEITGFTDSNIRNIIYKAAKEGELKRVSRGVYVSA